MKKFARNFRIGIFIIISILISLSSSIMAQENIDVYVN